MQKTPTLRLELSPKMLGKGGYGSVQLGQLLDDQGQVVRTVACKYLLQKHRDEPVAQARLQREIEVMEHLASVGRSDRFIPILGRLGKLGYVMPFYYQGALSDRVSSGAKLDPVQALGIISAIASSLQLAHELGIFHNDLKPDNILISDTGHPLISDWGLAWVPSEVKLTAEHVVLGAQAALDPALYQNPSLRSTPLPDIYGLGYILEQMSSPHPDIEHFVKHLKGTGGSSRILNCRHVISVAESLRVTIPQKRDEKLKIMKKKNEQAAAEHSILPLLPVLLGGLAGAFLLTRK